jgi:hypothetical protein
LLCCLLLRSKNPIGIIVTTIGERYIPLKTTKNISRFIPTFLFILLVLVSLACGDSASPTLVGNVQDQATSAPNSEAPEATQAVATSEEPTQAATANTPIPTGPQIYKVGDIVSIGDNVMVVLGWDVVPGDQFNKPDEGKKFIVVDAIIVNQSQTAMSVSSLLQMSLKDDTSQKYSVDLMASMAANASSIDGEIAPGERVRGKVGFQVPENAKGLQFVFDADVFGTGKVFVDLGAEPISVEPPTELTGETEQQTFNVGDIIEIGTLTLTVNDVTYPTGDQFNQPDSGNKFLVVDLTVENKGDSAASISTILQMWLKDSAGQKYDFDLMASVASGGTTPDGEIAPGEKIRGQVGFQVPENATDLVFVFDADIFGSGKIFVALP